MVHATGGFFSLMVAKEQVICSGGADGVGMRSETGDLR